MILVVFWLVFLIFFVVISLDIRFLVAFLPVSPLSCSCLVLLPLSEMGALTLTCGMGSSTPQAD